MSDDPIRLLGDLADQILAKVKGDLKDRWERLDERARADVLAATRDLAQLTLAAAAGRDVAQARAEAEATLRNWSFVGASQLQLAVVAAWREVLSTSGTVLAGLAKGFLRGLV